MKNICDLYFRFQTGGTILAGKLALDRGWAINIGGGFHHCSAEKGGGFCAYADITLLIKFLFFHFPKKVRNKIQDKFSFTLYFFCFEDTESNDNRPRRSPRQRV